MGFLDKAKSFMTTAFNHRVLPFFTFKFFLLVVLLLIFYYIFGGRFDGTLVSTIVRIVMYFLVIDLLVTYASRFIMFAYRREHKRPKDYVDNFTIGVKNMFSVFGSVLFFFVVMYILGVDLISLFTSLSIIAFALVFTFKEYISNFLGGIVIMFSDRYRLKDYIEVGSFKGRISDITFQNVVLKTDSKNYVYVPNAMLVSTGVINYSKEAIKTVKIDFLVDKVFFSHFSDLEKELKKLISSTFVDIVSSEDQVHLKVDSVEKDNAKLVLEIYANRYTFKSEEDMNEVTKKFVLTYLAKVQAKSSVPRKKS